MRKLLLATTALAGAALFAGAAQADIEVTVGGYNDFRAGFFGQSLSAGPGVARRHVDFENEFQLEVEAKAKTNSGVEYGAVANLWNGADYTNATTGGSVQGGNSVRFHQAYGYVNGVWGQVRAGDEHGVSDFAVETPMTYDFGAQVDGYYTEFVDATSVFAIAPSFIDDDENSTKVSYLTPKFGWQGHSFQAGVSYAPNFYDQGQSVNFFNAGKAASNYKDLVKIGGRYEGKFMDKVSALAGFVVNTADGSNLAAPGLTAAGSQSSRSFTSWELGAQLGYAGFTLGGGYTDAGSYNTTGAQNNDQYVWNVGLGYKFDRASIAGSYLRGAGYNNSGFGGSTLAATNTAGPVPAAFQNYVSDYSAWGIGAGYSLFDGMTTSIDAVFFDQNRPAGVGDTDGHVVILSNRVAF